MSLIWIIFIWLLAYHLDLFSAILLWKLKPKFFEVGETNEYLKRLLNKFSLGKAILIYDFTYSLQNILIINIALFFAYRLVIGDFDSITISISFMFMVFAHILGTLTNLYALFKKEKKTNARNKYTRLE